MRTGKPRVCPRQLDFPVCQIALVDPIQPHDVLVAAHLQKVPVVRRLRDLKAISVRIAQGMCNLGCIPHHFFRDAADIYAGSAQPVRLCDQNACTVFGGPLCARKAATTAAAYDEDIVVCHAAVPVAPERNRYLITRLSYPAAGSRNVWQRTCTVEPQRGSRQGAHRLTT